MKAAPLDEVSKFAREHVFSSLEARYREAFSPRELLSLMGEIGLLGLTVPERYGGSGGTPRDLAEYAREFTRAGCDLGLALCWITHLTLCAKSIEEFGTEEQKTRYLPRLCSGEMIGATAISEPETGAHPGRITTRALPSGDRFTLSGRKIFTTGGPEADLLVVLAVTGLEDDEKELTAFLVGTSPPEVNIETMDLSFLITAPHGDITFSEADLGPEDVLAGRGEGHSKVSKRAFARERSVILSAVSGLFATAANEAADRYRQKHEGMDLTGTDAGSWIHHLSALEVYRRLSSDLVEYAFSDVDEWKSSIDLLIYLGLSYGKWGYWLGEFVADSGLEASFPLDIILEDMKIVMVNENLLIKEGKKRFLR